jgi:hypothetical protein
MTNTQRNMLNRRTRHHYHHSINFGRTVLTGCTLGMLLVVIVIRVIF